MLIQLSKVVPNADNPRKTFDMVELVELSESIKKNGLLNPIAVEPAGDFYIINDGERRWRACQLAGMIEIEANVLEPTNHNGSERLVRSIVGNVQRVDMNIVETAEAYKKLQQAGYTAPEIADMVGKHVSGIYQYLALLEFPKEIIQLLRSGLLHGDSNSLKILRSIDDKKLQIRIAKIAADRGLSGKEIKALVRRMNFANRQRPHKSKTELTKSYVGHWNMIAQAGLANVSLDKNLKECAEQTCKACNLYEEADRVNCKDCPAVDLLKRFYAVQPVKQPGLMEA